MPSETLLSIVQDVMSDASMDEVDSISDTVDSLQVANIVRGVWQEVIALADMPKHASFGQLDATSTSTPTVLSIPTGVVSLSDVAYDSRSALTDPVNYVTLTYVEPQEFFRRTNGLDEDETEVELVSHSSGVTYKVMNDRNPTFYTVYNNRYILCNAYLNTLDTNLQQAKTRAMMVTEPTFSLTDGYTIDLDITLMSLLKEKSKARVFSRLKQTRDADAERSARRLEIRAQTTKDRLRGGVSYPNYGRKR